MKAGLPYGSIFINIGEIYLKKGDLEKAEAFYLKILNLDKGKELYFDDIASFYLKKGNLKESWKYLKESFFIWFEDEYLWEKIEPYKQYLSEDNFYAQISVGCIYYYSFQKYKEAIEHFEKALKLNKGEFDQYYSLGMSYKEIDKYKEAITYLEEALKLNSNHYDANLQLGILYGFSKFVADYYTIKPDYSRSVNLLEKAKTINLESEDPYFYLARTYENIGEFDKALQEALISLKIKPKYASFIQVASIYESTNDYPNALENYNKALEFYDNIYCRASVADVLIKLKRFDDAITFLNESEKKYQNNKVLNKTFGDVHFEKGEYKLAIEYYKDVLKSYPKHSIAHFKIALSYFRLSDLDSSEYWWKKTIEINPEESAAYFNLGLVNKNKSQYERAIENFNKYLKSNLGDKDAKNHIKECQYAIDLKSFPQKLNNLSLNNDKKGTLAKLCMCVLNYNKANELWINGLNETKYKDGKNIVSSKIYIAKEHLEKVKHDLNKIPSSEGKIKKFIEIFLFAVEEKIKGIDQHSEGFYKKRADYTGEYEKGRAKIKIADAYFVDGLLLFCDEIKQHEQYFGEIAKKELERIIKYYKD